MMLGPHIFGGFPVISFIITTSSSQSLRFCSSFNCLINAAGLTSVAFVLFSAICTNLPFSRNAPEHGTRYQKLMPDSFGSLNRLLILYSQRRPDAERAAFCSLEKSF